ncbi:MAG: Type II secretion system protein E [Burkholderiaceae bacterium]|nr:Type II secretion system protein E [Burkholderiaceae bacterium]
MDRPKAPVFNPRRSRLGDVLVSKGLIDDAQLAKALELQKTSGRKLGRALADLKLVTEEQIAEVVADQLGLRFVDLVHHRLDPQLVLALPEVLARRYRAIVLDRLSDGLLVGMVDPADMLGFDQLSRSLKSHIVPAVVTEGALLAAIEHIYQRKDEMASFAREVAADIGDGVLTLAGLENNASADEAPVLKLINSIFDAAVTRGVSDIHIEPQERALQIRFRIDGVMQVQSTPDSRVAGALVQRLKLMSSLDIAEKRLPQDGRFRVKVGSATLDVRISTLPTQFGESVVMRLLVQDTARMKLDRLGLPEPILARLRAVLGASSGMVLVTGPTGSGKTTTLYAALAELNTPEVKIITVEDPVEYRLPGLNQVQVNEKVDLTFARVLRSCLRQDPDVVLVGEMRDSETAEIGLRAALTGHLVLSTLHTNSAAATPIRLRDMGVAPYMVALGVRLVIAQRLVRLICAHCRSEVDAAAHEREWLGDDSGHTRAWRGTGCSACHQTGYAGRTAVYEMVEMTPELVHLANADDPAGFAAQAQRAFAEHTLRRHVLALVAEGRTTLAEAMRVGSGL